MLDIHEEARRIHETHKTTGAPSTGATPASAGVGSAAPPLSFDVHTISTADATTTGGAPKTAEAPTVV